MEKTVQTEEILGYMRLHGSITPVEAYTRFGCMRLGARIWDLKKEGYAIESKIDTSEKGKHFARYTLVECNKNGQYMMTGSLFQTILQGEPHA